jgi:hypothetical protein
MSQRTPILATLALLTACVGTPDPLPACDPASGAICDLFNPEDLALAPDPAWVLVSEMPHLDADSEASRGRGRLTAIRAADLERRALFPLDSAAASEVSEGWGDDGCPGAPDVARFQPHGIDVGTHASGTPALAVVNHGGREAIELFELTGDGAPAIEWRGCIRLPEGITANDVALLEGDGLVVTNFLPQLDGMGPLAIWTLLKISMGGHTGSVLRWTAADGFVEIEGSEASGPNGIAARPDGREIFVAEWGQSRVLRLREGELGTQRDVADLGFSPDNLTWTRDGALLVAGQHGGPMTTLPCSALEEGSCDIGYSVARVDPESLEVTRLIDGRGAASVALEVEDTIWVGSFAGDRIERIERPD